MEGRGEVFDKALRDLQAKSQSEVPSVKTILAEEYDRVVGEHRAALLRLDGSNQQLRAMAEKVKELLAIEEAGGSNSNEKVRVLLSLARLKEAVLK
jgi:hypothetical protein